jgi:hypothetical protein
MKSLACIFLAAVTGALLPLGAVEPVAIALVPALGLVAAGIIPAMILTPGAMLTGACSPRAVMVQNRRLRALLQLLAVSLALACLAIGAMLACIALAYQEGGEAPAGIRRGLMAVSGVSIAMMIHRVSAVVLGCFKGLGTHYRRAMKEAQAHSYRFFKEVRARGGKLSPDDYGKRRKKLIKVG